MPIKSDSHIFSGMQRDYDIAKHQSQFLYDAKNIRFTPIEGDTMLALTNERGPLEQYTLSGKYLGHCVFNDFVVIFTKGDNDNIYKVTPKEDQPVKLLYYGNLNFSLDNPIETLGVYENDYLSKVYWVDGLNQPRVIKLITPKEGEQEYDYQSRIFPNNQGIDTQFDFVASLSLNEDITVSRVFGEGMFAPGVIQYAFAYYKLNGQESNIFYTTPLNYITFIDRAGNPEERIANSFRIVMQNLDTAHFDFIRIFSIHRTSYDAVPTVKRLIDLNLKESVDSSLQFVDNGSMGDTIDPTELLYIGGEQIVAQTITSKDKTLFLGNLEIDREEISRDNLQIVDGDISTETIHRNTTISREGTGSGYYYYTNGLLNPNQGFKNREHYRLGIQFQHITGRWSIPIWLNDYTVSSDEGPNLTEGNNTAVFDNLFIQINLDLSSSALSSLKDKNYINYRPVCVLPTINDRLILTQGILCPTVFNYQHRLKDAPFSQSSWFFRLNPNKDIDEYSDNATSAWVEFIHNKTLRSDMTFGGEIQGLYAATGASSYVTDDSYGSTRPFEYAVDQSILTMHSPEIEFDEDINFLKDIKWKLRLVGVSNFTSVYGDIDIQVSSPAITGNGFNHYNVGYQDSDMAFRGMVAVKGWNDGAVYVDTDGKYKGLEQNKKLFIVYPWQRSGSLNNDTKRPADSGVRTAVLQTKKLSNLRFSRDNTWFNNNIISSANGDYNITPVNIFDSDQISLVKLQNINPVSNKTISYYGNVDTMIINSISDYKSRIEGAIENTVDVLTAPSEESNFTSDPNISVRIKYKSTKHIVFGLKNKSGYKNTVLPSIGNLNRTTTTITHKPEWFGDNSDPDNTVQTISDYYFPGENGYQDFNQWFNYRKQYYEMDPTYWEDSFIAYFPTSDMLSGVVYKLIRNQIAYAGQGDTQEDEFDWYYRPLNINEKKYNFYLRGQSYLYRHIGNGNIEFDHDTRDDQQSQTLEEDWAPFQGNIDILLEYPYLFLGELYREENTETDFGGRTNDAFLHNTWIPAGKSKKLPDIEQNVNNYNITLLYDQGDTWYTRYDCLKTYPFTEEDENSIIEVGSFMCESRVNGDGRYDKNRGEINNILNFRPTNFNLLNPVYSQHDNFFSYKILDSTLATQNLLPNTITWSKENPNGNDIDLWTNITMANTLDLDGVQGQIRSLQLFNDKIICFQDTAISNILFNSRVQIPVSDGVPIEISNGQKVDGSVYISTTYGCNNKWSIAITPSGIYFVDTTSRQLMNLGEGISSVSGTHGFSEWFRSKDNHQTLKTSYDFINNDLYLNWDDTSLIFNEILGQFTSFMSYEKSHSMFNIGNDTLCLRDDNSNCKVYKMFSGDYCTFFGQKQDYWIQFISNQDSSLDKTFLNIESRIDFKNNNEYMPRKFFDYIRVTDEYQDTQDTIITTNRIRVTNPQTSGRKKFRIWRTEIPRAFDVDKDRRTLDRIRNTWASIKLRMDSQKEDDNWGNTQMIMHDLEVQYFI